MKSQYEYADMFAIDLSFSVSVPLEKSKNESFDMWKHMLSKWKTIGIFGRDPKINPNERHVDLYTHVVGTNL
jgi:hypothetical protein